MILNIKPCKNHTVAGDYFGKIIAESESSDGEYLWLKVEFEDFILNVSISANNQVLIKLCQEIAKEEKIKDLGQFDTKLLVNKCVCLTLEDKEIDGKIYNKINHISTLGFDPVDVDF